MRKFSGKRQQRSSSLVWWYVIWYGLFVWVLSGSGCSRVDDLEQVESAVASLSAFDWSSARRVADFSAAPALASLGNTDYLAFVPQSSGASIVRFSQRGVDGVWSSPIDVPGAATRSRIAMAAFDGKIYLVTHLPWPAPPNSLAMSRFDPLSQTWSNPSQLPFTASFSFALSAHQQKLVLIGDVDTEIWIAAMNPDGTWDAALPTPLRGIDVSTVSHAGLLQVAFASITSPHTVFYSAFDGLAWLTPATVATGNGNNVLYGMPALASYVSGDSSHPGNCLHMVVGSHTSENLETSVWWTYRCVGDSRFAVPTTIPGASHDILLPVSLSAGAGRLILGFDRREVYNTDVEVQEYHYPPAPPCSLPGACTPGAVRSVACGLCGAAVETCTASCQWQAGQCSGQGACSPGATRSVRCGACGLEVDTCSASCQWQAGVCGGQGECTPGTVAPCCGCSRRCSCLGQKTCGARCTWGSCQGYQCGTGACQ